MSLFSGTPLYQPPKCDRCERLLEQCDCPEATSEPNWLPPEKQTATISKQKRKKGKQVTIIAGLDPQACDLKSLVKQLKDACGSGGTIKEDQIEIQGDSIEVCQAKLAELGFKTKLR